MGNLPKSDSNTSLSSLISIGNESKISEIAVNDKCIICLCEDNLKSSFVNQQCNCKYYYHEECLRTWHEKHSSLCPICRKYSGYSSSRIFPMYIVPRYILIFIGLGLTIFTIFIVVKLVLKD
jgi:hypothetical protein